MDVVARRAGLHRDGMIERECSGVNWVNFTPPYGAASHRYPPSERDLFGPFYNKLTNAKLQAQLDFAVTRGGLANGQRWWISVLQHVSVALPSKTT